MKNKLSFFSTTLFLAFLLMLPSCMKEEFVQHQEPSINAKNMDELVAPTNFQWRTSTTVIVDLTGLNTPVPVTSTLSISSKQNVLYKSLHLMSESKTIIVDVPTTDRILTLQFGSITIDAPIVDNKVAFSFIPTIY